MVEGLIVAAKFMSAWNRRMCDEFEKGIADPHTYFEEQRARSTVSKIADRFELLSTVKKK